VREIPLLKDLVLFHELVHAWQYHNLSADFPKDPDKAFVLNALLEGHAEWCTYRFSRQEGISKLFERLAATRSRWIPSASGRMLDAHFIYVESMAFFRYLSEQRPHLRLQDVIGRALPTERQIVFPHEYVQNVTQEHHDLSPGASLLTRIAIDSEGRLLKSVIGYSALKLYLRRVGCREPRLDKILAHYTNGIRYVRSHVWVTALAFDSPKAAEVCFDVVESDYQKKSGGRTVSTGWHEQFPYATKIGTNHGMEKLSQAVLFRDENVVIEAIFPRDDRVKSDAICSRRRQESDSGHSERSEESFNALTSNALKDSSPAARRAQNETRSASVGGVLCSAKAVLQEWSDLKKKGQYP